VSVPRESIGRTLFIAVAVALVCSAMVSGAVYVLRPMQSAYALLERNRVIVELAAVLSEGELASDVAVVQAYLDLDARVVDLETGQFVAALDGYSFDHWLESNTDQEQPRQQAPEPRIVPVYFAHQGRTAAHLVLPVHGRGMWSTIYGYVALETDLNTIAGVMFHRHGETPGIGDRIQDPSWLASWAGKRIYDESGLARIGVTPTAGGSRMHQIDLIAGASVTSESVGRFVNEQFSADGYGPWLARLRQESDGVRN
jgi:Na+-transporting NADH:ubiquinone oxidoreductase subunit C